MWQNTKGWSGWPWSGGKWQTSGWKRLAGISGAANDALRAFYDAMGGDSWTDNTGWGTSSAAYFGVTISSGTVTAISLPGNNLDGDASNTLDPLAGTLATLDLGQNTALDDIDVSALTALADIDLAGCDFGSSVVAGILANVVTAGVSSGTLDIGGSNSSPTPAGVTALLALEDDSWTLTYSTVIMENTGSFYAITADGDATIRSSATDFSGQTGKYIVVKDSAGKYATAYGHAADDAEAISATEKITSLTNRPSYLFDTFIVNANGHDVDSAISDGSDPVGFYSNSFEMNGLLWYITADLTVTAGSSPTLSTIRDGLQANQTLFNPLASGAQARYWTGCPNPSNLSRIDNGIGMYLAAGPQYNFALQLSCKQVTALGTDALQLRNQLASGGSSRNWTSKEAGFNPNDIDKIEVFNAE